MTLSTSLVAVWYSSDSSRSPVRCCNSPISRAFSIAITACAAKFCSSAICLSVNGRTSWRKIRIAPSTPSSLRNAHDYPGADRRPVGAKASISVGFADGLVGMIGLVDDIARREAPPQIVSGSGR